MRFCYLFAVVLCSIGIAGAQTEIVTKLSNPFSLTVGVTTSTAFVQDEVSLVCKATGGMRSAVLISWAFKGITPKVNGKITIMNLLGVKAASFVIREAKGSVVWKGLNGRQAGGVYLVTLTNGSVKKTEKIVANPNY